MLYLEYRKLIKFGNSSYVVSVPNNWIKKNKLEKGQTISVEENSNNELVFSVFSKEKKIEKKEISINVDGKTISRIKREIIGAYIKNYNSIILNGKDISSYEEGVKNIIHNLMALEIIDHSSNRIVTKDFLDFEEVTFNEIVRKVDNITRSMFADIKMVAKKDYATSIDNRDEEVNRLVYLIMRALRFNIDNPRSNFTYKNKINTVEILDIWDLVISIEKVADSIKRTARKFSHIKSNPRIINPLMVIFKEIEQFYWDTMKAYYNRDVELAYGLSSNKSILAKKCNEMHEKYWNIKHAPIILENFKDTIASIHTIGRIVYG